ncbi:hypothetical protein GCM10010522_44730 [Kribbella solani]
MTAVTLSAHFLRAPADNSTLTHAFNRARAWSHRPRELLGYGAVTEVTLVPEMYVGQTPTVTLT